MPQTLRGKIAVVTGAGRGVGSEIAQRLVKSGAKVVLVARSVEQLILTEELISKTGGFVYSIPADISSENEVESIKKNVKDNLGQTDILVNAAGVFGPLKMIKDSDPENWIQTIQINLLGPYYMCRTFVGDMIESGWGRIINVSSAASLHIPGPLNSAYATSKVALNQLTRHLAAEITNTGVTANVIHPGDVKTNMWKTIRSEISNLGPEADDYRNWVSWVNETGGDPPAKAADLIIKLVEEGEKINGRFLWIQDGLQDPIESWGESAVTQPWKD
ncbi:MAG: SDR family NAD(P)-dependent oxidoreductase [SAR324 cluster bacterium]|nr:SDR family NAD(P)-dependent oxidoreductase [SAR324 cluster bacterium]